MTHARRRLGTIGLVALALMSTPMGSALAFWSAAVNGTGTGTTDRVNPGPQPSTAAGAAESVSLQWTAGSTAAGHTLTGYRVNRYTSSTGGTAVAASGGCAGIVTAVQCTEQGVTPGTWYYAITPVLNTWTGAAGPRSAPTMVAAASLTLGAASSYPGGTVSGNSVAGFGATEAVSIRLDSVTGTVLATSPATVTTDASGGASAFSVSLPTSATTGPHTLYAVGSVSGVNASAAMTVSAAPAVSFTGSTVAAGQQVTGGAVSGFVAGEGISLHLDSATGTTLVTSPATVTTDSTGAASSISATVPSTTSTGSHTVYAVGVQSGRTASTTITVTSAADTTPPNSPTISSPASGGTYGANWSGTITGSASDNSGGSGVASTQISIQNGAGKYWNGTSFATTTLVWLATTGASSNTSWSYAFARPADGGYTVTARSTDNAGNVSAVTAPATTFTIDTVAPNVTAVTLANGTNGSVQGTADNGDTVTVTFSKVMDATAFCSSWTNNGLVQTLNGASAELLQNGANDTIGNVSVTVETGCGGQLAFGTVGTGGNYLKSGSSAVFTNSIVKWDPATKTLTLTLGAVTAATSGGVNTGVAPTKAATYTEPTTGLKDMAGNLFTGDTSTTHTYTFTSPGVSGGF